MGLRLLAYGLAGAVVVLDRLTKIWIRHNVTPWDRIPVIPGLFDIVHTENRGMAFGLMNESASSWRTLLLVGVAGAVLVAVAVLIWRLPGQLSAHQRFSSAALGLILGGAIGNVYDRVVQGGVTDFLDLYVGRYHWPAFNVADSAITVGAVLVALDLLWSPAEKENK